MKVCFISQYSSTNNAGASLSMFNIANEMAYRGIDVTIVLANKNNLENIEIDDSIRILQIPFYSMRMTLNMMKWDTHFKFSIKSLYNNFVAMKIAMLLNEDRPDVIHINGLDNAIGAQVAHFLKIPYVWHIRQFLEDDFGQKLFHEKYIYSLVRNANEVIAISEDVRENFEPIIGRPITVIYNGIPVEKYTQDRKMDFTSNIKMLLAGRIYKQKGQDTAVKATKDLLEFFGGGGYKRYIPTIGWTD